MTPASKRRRFRFSLKQLFGVVTLMAIAIPTLSWATTASWLSAPNWLFFVAYLVGTACAFGAAGTLFGRGVLAAKVGAVLGSAFVAWSVHELDVWQEAVWCETREAFDYYYPDTFLGRRLWFFLRALGSLTIFAGIALAAEFCWRQLRKRVWSEQEPEMQSVSEDTNSQDQQTPGPARR